MNSMTDNEKVVKKFSEFLGKRESDTVCEIHNVKFWEISVPTPTGYRVQEFCPECQKKARDELSFRTLQKDYVNSQLANTYKLFNEQSIISEELRDANFNNFEIETTFDNTALNFSKRIGNHYYKGGSGNTVFIGVPGVGKSHLSIALAKGLNDSFKKSNEPKSVIFMPVNRIFSKIKSTFNSGGKFTEDYAIDLLSKVDYLFLDDFGKESCMSNQIKPASDWVQNILFSILDHRKATVINTNFSRNQLLKIYDAALVDRIFKGTTENKQVIVWPEQSVSKR
ncbi:ATP-binding protein [Streptococcus uberis]|uniref:ATP-binding protein n=1 Tax=Streptococcus uberis TaxID=1349 RepID=UPI00193ABB6E|nr:ATP-binding protein [Streptococcus uberis]